jgi:site-specific DNA-cytosine methylase
MKVLELFAGSRSIGKVAESMGSEVWSCDISEFEGINDIGDIRNFDYSKVPFIPDVIWASPPCESWSIACAASGGNVYWETVRDGRKTVGIKPREDFSGTSSCKVWKNPELVKQVRDMYVALLEKTFEIIEYYKPKVWFIENPVGYMRFYVKDRVPYTNMTSYCQYGFPYRKNTNIFSNVKLDLKQCICETKHKAISDVHKSYYERSKIPNELCLSIMKQTEIYVSKPSV